MNILDLLVGKEISINTDVGVPVTLTIKEVIPRQRSRQITPDTKENDWYGESVYWTEYEVKFTNGYAKIYDNLESIKILN